MAALLVELVGTFLFLSVIVSVGEPIAIAVALAAMIFFGGKISGGHFNPAVSLMFFMKNELALPQLVMYVVAQLAGATAALAFYRYAKVKA